MDRRGPSALVARRAGEGRVEVFRYRRYTFGQYLSIFVLMALLLFVLTLLPGRHGGPPLIDTMGLRGVLLFFVVPMLVLIGIIAVYTHHYTLRLHPQGVARHRVRIPWHAITAIEEGMLRMTPFVRIVYVRDGRTRSLRVMLPLRDAHGQDLVPRLRARWEDARATQTRRQGTTARGVATSPR